MNRKYLILVFLVFLVAITAVSAQDNDTAVMSEENTDLVSADEKDSGNVSLSEDEAVNETGEVLAGVEDNETLGVSTSENVLNTSVSVEPLASSYYSSPTKKDRTFSIGKFKATLSKKQYNMLFDIREIEDYFFDSGDCQYYYIGEKYSGYGISSTGLFYHAIKKTNKYVKVKVKIGNKFKYKKSRVYINVIYGAGQSGIPHTYMVYLSEQYINPGYDYAKVLGKNAKYFSKCKISSSLTKLNKCKLKSSNKVYKKYYAN